MAGCARLLLPFAPERPHLFGARLQGIAESFSLAWPEFGRTSFSQAVQFWPLGAICRPGYRQKMRSSNSENATGAPNPTRSIWIKCSYDDGSLTVSVRDDGPGGSSDGGQSHKLGLRFLGERLQAAYGPSSNLRVCSDPTGFEASFVVPSSSESPSVERVRTEERK
jgi:hypothetical protein